MASREDEDAGRGRAKKTSAGKRAAKKASTKQASTKRARTKKAPARNAPTKATKTAATKKAATKKAATKRAATKIGGPGGGPGRPPVSGPAPGPGPRPLPGPGPIPMPQPTPVPGPGPTPIPTPTIPGLKRRPPSFVRPPRGPGPALPPRPRIDPQLLVPRNVSPNVDEGLEARVKDPLWFLARQWQTGELSAESGGNVAQVEVQWDSTPVTTLRYGTGGGSTVTLDPAHPLEEAIERELADGSSPAWNAARLEYQFSIDVGPHRLRAEEYDGHALDWYHFDLDAEGTATAGTTNTTTVLPKNLRFTGMPHPRWWRFEAGDVDLTAIASSEPNLLQMLLAEFVLVDSNNWYVVPLEMPAGHLRRVTRVRTVDTFGVSRDLPPAIDKWGRGTWELFTASAAAATREIDGRYLFVPNLGGSLLSGDVLEQVDIVRDEDANIVWAIERYYTPPGGERVNRGDEEGRTSSAITGIATAPQLSAEARAYPIYRLKSAVPRHWIPYVPERVAGAANPQMYLRRARSDEAASRAVPQYRTLVLGESWRIEEEEVPRTGLQVRRLWRFARGADDKALFWIGRRKDVTAAEESASVDFDYVVPPP